MLLSRKPNLTILIVTMILVLFGLFMLTSAGSVISQEKFGQSFYFTKNQIIKGLLPGLALGFLAFSFSFKSLKKLATPIYVFCVILMILVFIPHIGLALGGAKRWISISGFNFQPSEIFKLGFVVFLAKILEKNASNDKNVKSLILPFLIVLLTAGLLIGLQPDLGTLGVFIVTAAAMYFIAHAPLRHMFLLAVLSVAALVIFIMIFPHASQRIQVLIHPQSDTKGIGYQMEQGLIALGSGGIFGQGLAQGKQKFLYLPQATGDSIVAVIGEELGFIGMLVLISLFATFALQGYKIAKKTPDNFSKYLAVGLTSMIVIQAFINIMANIGLIPLTGVTLPFISYGGTSLAVSLVAIGLLLNISKQTKSASNFN